MFKYNYTFVRHASWKKVKDWKEEEGEYWILHR